MADFIAERVSGDDACAGRSALRSWTERCLRRRVPSARVHRETIGAGLLVPVGRGEGETRRAQL